MAIQYLHKMFVLKYLIVTVISIFFHEAVSDEGSSCETQKTCGECIGYAQETCVWCLEVNFDGILFIIIVGSCVE